MTGGDQSVAAGGGPVDAPAAGGGPVDAPEAPGSASTASDADTGEADSGDSETELDVVGGPAISEELATTAIADQAFADTQGVPAPGDGEPGEPAGTDPAGVAAAVPDAPGAPGEPAGTVSDEPDSSDPAGVAAAVVARERDEFRDALVRLQADFENFKKRMAKQHEELRDRAAESLVEKLLPVLDTADLALAHGGGEDVKHIYSSLVSALEREGLERIDDPGATFDPTLHDAVAHEPGDGRTQEVAEVMRAGYRWRGRVLRAAMVKVRG